MKIFLDKPRSIAVAAKLAVRPKLSWGWRQITAELKDAEWRPRDLVSIISPFVTILTLILGLWTLRTENEGRTLDSQVGTETQTRDILESELARRRDHAENTTLSDRDLYLISPIYDERVLTTSTPVLYWKNLKESKGIDYLIELKRLDQATKNLDWAPATECIKSKVMTNISGCRIRVKAAEGQTRVFSGSQILAGAGRYLWRVAAVSAHLTNDQLEGDHRWSEYGSFCLAAPAGATAGCIGLLPPGENGASQHIVLVGTSTSENISFSNIEGGRRSGKDIAFIQFLVEHCVGRSQDSFVIRRGCPSNAAAPLDGSQLSVVFKTYDSINDGLEAVDDGHIDLFIGGMTATSERDQNRANLYFTSGYDKIVTSIYTQPGWQQDSTWKEWIRGRVRTVGVIQGSTNESLARELEKGESRWEIFRTPLKLDVLPYPDFATLKEAFRAEKVDGVLIDQTLKQEIEPATSIDVSGTPQYERYVKEVSQIRTAIPEQCRDCGLTRELNEHLSVAVHVPAMARKGDVIAENSLWSVLQTLMHSKNVKDRIEDIYGHSSQSAGSKEKALGQ